ncbi:MAG: MFS transporter [Arenibacterium sp.]
MPLNQSDTPPRLITLILLTAAATLSLNMFLPSLANIARDLNTTYAVASLAVAGYLAASAVIYLVIGPLSDRYGRRPVLLVALIMFTFASLGCALATDIRIFLLCRLLQGGMVGGSALSMAIVRDTTPKEQAAGLLGYIAMAMALAPMLGPALGGVLDANFGWRANFYAYAGAGAALLLLAWFDLGETRPDTDTSAKLDFPALATLSSDPRFLSFALCTAMSTGAFYMFVSGVPLVAATAFGISTSQLGFYIGSITGGFMFGSFLSGRLAPHFRLTTMMLAGRITACAGLSLGGLFLLLGMVSPALFFGSTIFVGIGNGLTMPSSNSGAMSVRPSLTGSAAGLNGSLNVATGAALTALAGSFLTLWPTPLVLVSLMLASSAGGLWAALWARWQNADQT